MASFANCALSSDTYVTNATPRPVRILTKGVAKDEHTSLGQAIQSDSRALTPLYLSKLFEVALDHVCRITCQSQLSG